MADPRAPLDDICTVTQMVEAFQSEEICRRLIEEMVWLPVGPADVPLNGHPYHEIRTSGRAEALGPQFGWPSDARSSGRCRRPRIPPDQRRKPPHYLGPRIVQPVR
jgi:hypothetical protein